jgi:amino acid adenylation domain-containing protein
MGQPVIRVEDLSKVYRVGTADNPSHTTLKEAIAGLARPRRRQANTAETEQAFWALRDVGFEVEQGDVTGLIGVNGAGKSTLLKILAHITEPTTGRAAVRGRVASLLEVGTGFHPELTGRENVLLNGAILGMTRHETRRKFDQIVEFAGVERFIDTPVKRYSSGMYLRLAFAVAAHLDPEVLLVDEVLAVGDIAFQRRCLGRMREVSQEGRTVLLVSHNLVAIEALCTRCLLLDAGRLVLHGDVADVTREYRRRVQGDPGSGALILDRTEALPGRRLALKSIVLQDEFGETTRVFPLGGALRAVIGLDLPPHSEAAEIVVRIDDPYAQRMMTIKNPASETRPLLVEGPQQIECLIPEMPLVPGDYAIGLAIYNHEELLDEIDRALTFTITNNNAFGAARGASRGVCIARSEWKALGSRSDIATHQDPALTSPPAVASPEAATEDRSPAPIALAAPYLIAPELELVPKPVDAPVLSPAERHRVLVQWNATQLDLPKRCVHQLFEAQARVSPDRVAIDNGADTLTYRQLNGRANQLAVWLRRRGVGPEARIGICMRPSIDMIVAVLGVLKAGGAYVPIDPSDPTDRIRCIIKSSSITRVLTHASVLPALNDIACIPMPIDRDWDQISDHNVVNLPTLAGPTNLAYVIYTSDSTGTPRGVMIEHRSLMNYLDWTLRAYAAPDEYSVPLHTSLTCDLSITAIFPTLLAGGRLSLLPDGSGVEALADALACRPRHALVKLTPAQVEMLAERLPPPTRAHGAFRFVIGGEELNGKSLQLWRQHAPEMRIVNEYGPSEATVGCCTFELCAADCPDGPLPIGRPIANTRLYVLDLDLNPVPIGCEGELFIGGDGLARGYLGQPDFTAENFVPNPFADQPGERLYRTGDIVKYLPDGNLVYVGRADHQIAPRGFRLELDEIDTGLSQRSKTAATLS